MSTSVIYFLLYCGVKLLPYRNLKCHDEHQTEVLVGIEIYLGTVLMIRLSDFSFGVYGE
jgi:hypothetical protein